MDSITHALKSCTANRLSGVGQILRHTLLLGICAMASPAHASEFVITEIDTHLHDNVYLLDADIDFHFSDEALEALDNGVPLTVQLNIEINRVRNWWLDVEIATLQQRYTLQYHALSHQYLLQNLNSGAYYAYHTLDAALVAMGTLRDFPLLDAKLVEPGNSYEVDLQAELDIEALPSPLRPLAYVTPAWRLESDWYTWSLTP